MIKEIYTYSPEFIKNTARMLRKKIPFPYVYGPKFVYNYNLLSQTQWWDRKDLEVLQYQKLMKIINHAYENVPYYKKLFNEYGIHPKHIQNINDIKKLPIMTKDDVRKNFDELKAANAHLYKPFINQSGGTTGTPLQFYLDCNSSLMENAFVWRYRIWAGYSPKDKQIIMRYKLIDEISEKDAPYMIEGNIMYLSAFHIKETNIEDYINKIIKFQPKTIWSFPSTLYVLAKYINKNKSKEIKLSSITTSSETLFPIFREEIEEAFGCQIYDWYGSNEQVISAGQCEQGSLHINNEYGLFEVLNDKGESVKEGEVGTVVGTAFHKFAMPFLRYKLGDRAMLSSKKCSCGRELPIIKSLEGRIDDLIITKNGNMVGRLDEAFHESYGIKMSQIIQDEIGKMEVKIVKDDNFTEKDINILDNELRKRLGNNMEISYEFIENIERTQRGKYRFVISNLNTNIKS